MPRFALSPFLCLSLTSPLYMSILRFSYTSPQLYHVSQPLWWPINGLRTLRPAQLPLTRHFRLHMDLPHPISVVSMATTPAPLGDPPEATDPAHQPPSEHGCIRCNPVSCGIRTVLVFHVYSEIQKLSLHPCRRIQ